MMDRGFPQSEGCIPESIWIVAHSVRPTAAVSNGKGVHTAGYAMATRLLSPGRLPLLVRTSSPPAGPTLILVFTPVQAASSTPEAATAPSPNRRFTRIPL